MRTCSVRRPRGLRNGAYRLPRGDSPWRLSLHTPAPSNAMRPSNASVTRSPSSPRSSTPRSRDLIREFDERGGCVAHALATLPRIRRALAAGEISYSKARAVTRVATPETEERLLQVARAGTTAHVEQIVRGWRSVDRHAEVKDAARQHRLRGLQVYQDEDGTVVVRGRLTPEAGAVVMRALEAAR